MYRLGEKVCHMKKYSHLEGLKTSANQYVKDKELEIKTKQI